MVDQLPVLIVEDEFLIALALSDAVKRSGRKTVGPVASVSDALTLVEQTPIAAAILDGRLRDGEVMPVMDKLLALGVPFVLHSGTGIRPELDPAYADVVVVLKPAEPQDVIVALDNVIARTPARMTPQ